MTTDDVVTRDDFVLFVNWMARESAKDNCDWENIDLPYYLEALAAFADDSRHMYYDLMGLDVKKLSKWRIFADVLWAATAYE